MKIEEQVLSREQMKHLQELGVDTSDASMAWYMSPNTNQWKIKIKDKFAHEMLRRISPERYIPTYTIGDLIEKLPVSINRIQDRKILIEGEYTEACYTDGGDYCPFFYSHSTLIKLLYNLLCVVAENHKELLKMRH